MGELDTLTGSALAQIRDAGTLPALEEIRVRWLGKKGTLTEQLKTLGALPASERPTAGASINAAKYLIVLLLNRVASWRHSRPGGSVHVESASL